MADVEDPYGVLGVSRNAERSEIRKKFQELARKFHPDKLSDNASQSEREDSTSKFHRLIRAYHTLADNDTRHQHDIEIRAKEMAENLLINDEVSFSQMKLDDECGEYSSDCRCGGVYLINTEELNFSSIDRKEYYVVGCDTCSLHIKIIF